MLNLTTEWQKIKIDYMGNEITMEIKPMSTEHSLLLSPFMSFDGSEKMAKRLIDKKNTEGEDSLTKDELILLETHNAKSHKQSIEMQKAARSMFKDVVRNIEGVTVDNKPLQPESLGVEASLTSLAVIIIGELFAKSTLDEVSEKNLQSPLGERSAARTVADS